MFDLLRSKPEQVHKQSQEAETLGYMVAVLVAKLANTSIIELKL